MRTASAPERAIIAARRMLWALRVEMQGKDGNWRQLTALAGKNWVTSARWRWNLDQPVMSGELTLHRSVGALSLAPLMATSSLNQTGVGGTAGPMVDARRRVRISLNTRGPAGSLFSGIGGAWSGSGVFNFSAVNVNNGDFVANAYHTDTSVPGAYAQVDMGAAVTFDQVRMWIATAPYAGIYKVRGSADGAAWTDIASGFTPSKIGENVFYFPSSTYRYWRLELTNTPGAGSYVNEIQFNRDWREMFSGYTDKYSEGGGDKGVMTIPMRDIGALLQDTVTETEQTYGSAGGTDGAVVMNQILTANQGILGGLIPLYVPVAIPIAVRTYKLPIGSSIMDALNAIARKGGAVVRYEYDAAHVLRLTFFRPDKTKTVPDYTFATSEYLALDDVSADVAGLRNVVAVPFTDSAPGGTGQRLVVWAEATADNLLQYGRRAMILGQEATSQINSTAEATVLANAARDDTAYPYATGNATHRLTWWVQGGDLLRYASDGRHASSNLDIGVMQFEHSITIAGDEVQGRTTIAGRPNIAVLYHTWLRLSASAIDEAVADAMTPIISIKLLPELSTNTTVTYQVDAQMPDGSAVAAIFWALGDDAFTATIASGGLITIPRATNDSGDRLLRIRAIGANGWMDERTVTVDYDAIPAISAVAEAIPIYSAGVQTGWRLKGSVDDDTRALVIALTAGLTLGAVTPLPSPPFLSADGTYWIDTSAHKTWSIDLLQAAGARGTVTLTPREFFNDAAPGLGGLPYVLTLDRPGITTATTRELDAVTREVTLTAQPSTAIINYRIDGGIWQTATGKVTFTLDVSAADRVVEFYSTTASGSTEDQKRLVVDRDSQPSITSLVVTEVIIGGASHLHLDVGFDDDVVAWRMWARRALYPTASGSTAADPILEQYKRYDGGMEKLSLDWRAGGTGATDGTSDWYGIVRAYDAAGNFVQQTFSKRVSGAPPVVGALSNVRAQSNTEGGLRYNDILWDHNQSVQDTAHTVTIRESDNGAAYVQVVAGRDARLEHDNGSASALIGGYHLQKPGANPGDPGAVFKTFAYQIDLRRTSDNALLATYSASMSAWYAGGGGGGGSPPSAVPATLAIFGEQLQARGTWTNPVDTASLIRIEWQKWNGAAWVAHTSRNLPANSVTDTQTGLVGGDLMRFRVIYYNGFGDSTGGYATSGSATVQEAGSAPTETPDSLNIAALGGQAARASWINTSSAYQVRVSFYRDSEPFGTDDYPAGTTQADRTGYGASHFGSVSVAYFNEVGEGPSAGPTGEIPIT